jgi:hypothetical protein
MDTARFAFSLMSARIWGARRPEILQAALATWLSAHLSIRFLRHGVGADAPLVDRDVT